MSNNDKNKLDSALTEAWQQPDKLPPLPTWLAATHSEAAHAQYAFIILKKHLTRAGIEIKNQDPPSSWWSFSWDCYLNIHTIVSKESHPAMLTELLAELVDLTEGFSGKYFAYHLKVLLEHFIDRDPPYSQIKPHLPEKVLAKMAEIQEILREEHEEDMRRADQMSY